MKKNYLIEIKYFDYEEPKQTHIGYITDNTESAISFILSEANKHYFNLKKKDLKDFGKFSIFSINDPDFDRYLEVQVSYFYE